MLLKTIPHWHNFYLTSGKWFVMAKKKIKDGNDHPKKEGKNVKEKAIAAHQQADKDIEQDPDLTTRARPEDNLDEGELARLEGED